jgi:hypothetical protein
MRNIPKGATQTPAVLEIMQKYYTEPEQSGLHRNDFDGMTLDDAKRILQLVPEEADKQQNDSPTFEEFVELGEQIPDILFHGYHITRTMDERITIEGCYIPIGDDHLKDVITLRWKLVAHGLRHANEVSEINFRGQQVIRLWWD